MLYIIISTVKELIAINHIQNKSFCLHSICLCNVYIYYVHINTQPSHAFIYLRKIGYVYILNIYNENYMNINICTYYSNIYTICVCVFIYA